LVGYQIFDIHIERVQTGAEEDALNRRDDLLAIRIVGRATEANSAKPGCAK
jgi:hypothetical protein